MASLYYQERLSNIQILEQNLSVLPNESLVKKPYPTIKSLFYDKRPKNRKNLKNIETRKPINNQRNGTYKNKLNKKVATIESIINNSKTNEFLSLDNPNNNYKPIIIYPLYNYVNQNSSSTIDTIKKNGNSIFNKVNNNIDEISNHSRNNKLNKSLNDIQLMKSKKASKMTNSTFHKKMINLNDLYKEYIENVR
jgi:hypothetical protein